MAEESILADVTRINTFGREIIIYAQLITNLPKALKTGIPSDNGRNECGINEGDEVSVITNSPFPSKIEADACKTCRFTTARGAKLPLVCNVFRGNR